jgi:hypothetical protein
LVNSGIDYEHVTFRFYRSFSRNELRFNVGVDGNQSQQSTRRFSFNNTTSLGYNKTIGKHTLVLLMLIEYFKAHLRTLVILKLVWTPKTLSPGDGSGFISDNGLNDFFVPRVNVML